jgi:hypothetical protein
LRRQAPQAYKTTPGQSLPDQAVRSVAINMPSRPRTRQGHLGGVFPPSQSNYTRRLGHASGAQGVRVRGFPKCEAVGLSGDATDQPQQDRASADLSDRRDATLLAFM